MAEEYDFQGLAKHLLTYSNDLVPELLPGGRVVGAEWTCGDLTGTRGSSCKVNLKTGRWSDFATNDAGGDLISLYGRCHGISNGEAFKFLSKKYNYSVRRCEPSASSSLLSASAPSLKHYRYGNPSQSWTYRDMDGNPLFFIARYDTADGKQFCPWSYHDGKLVAKAHPEPRPLYNLDKIINNPSKPILICEGEKSCEAAEKITDGKYVCTTWPNGSKSAHKADWRPLYDRNVLIWPDADKPGAECADKITKLLYGHCKQVKIINPDNRDNGWDAADAINDGWSIETFVEWAKPRATLITGAQAGNVTAVAAVQVNVNTEDVPAATQSNYALWEQLGLPVSANGHPIISIDCGTRIITGSSEIAGHIWYDEFYQRIFTDWNGPLREWSDVDNLNLCLKIQREYGLARMSDKTLYDAVRVVAHSNRRNEPKDYLESLEWDKTPRIRRFFCDYYGVSESEYAFAISQNWWISMVARIYHPGCQCDNMVILKGPQGKFKSSSLRVIGGRWYTSSGHNVLSKEFYQILQGKLIVEIGEMDSFARAEVNTIKDVVTNPTDRYRTPYDRLPDDHPRQCVFVGTTNKDLILKDETGGRRFWPVDITEIKLDDIKRDRNQLFAEAVHLYKQGKTWYEVPIQETLSIQEDNREYDEWEQYIAEYFKKNIVSQVTVFDIAVNHLKITADKVDVRIQRRVGRCLRILGWERKIVRDGDSVRRVWMNKNNKQPEIEWDD